jgi:trehalose/maltose transport system permease protein
MTVWGGTVSSLVGPEAAQSEQEAVEDEFSGQKQEKRAKIATGEGRTAFYLIFPSMLLLALVVGYPIFYAVYHSMQSDTTNVLLPNGQFATTTHFVGLEHYRDWLTQRCHQGNTSTSCPTGNIGSQFWIAIKNTLFYTVVTVTLETTIGMIFALMMNKAFRGRGWVRAAILVPWAIPTAVTAKLWVVIFDQNGIFNKVFHTNYAWTVDTWPGRFAIIIADVWKTTPFMALLILAGLQIIPAELYESAKMDGATAWQRFVKITLPLAKPAIAVALIFRSMDVLRMYDLPAILTPSAPGTDTISVLVVKALRQNVNAAAALSTITFIFIFLCAFILVRVLGANVVGSQARGVK